MTLAEGRHTKPGLALTRSPGPCRESPTSEQPELKPEPRWSNDQECCANGSSGFSPGENMTVCDKFNATMNSAQISLIESSKRKLPMQTRFARDEGGIAENFEAEAEQIPVQAARVTAVDVPRYLDTLRTELVERRQTLTRDGCQPPEGFKH
ncbi:uncharacterized protein BO66DRAFT_454407 [Aspergillus aculeatinus CBS 121060]|uniref:Uncharacterized protein n=1 Tax=Aspergillus aculeatinus CBS 121060 TaxID=1448322 RepID=A0ACD1H5Z3_9EURO|nr:hypothetical protein BO66DRAFT_454407 [Aspergillus aculeatinus CBS 121060]RAH68999.1 hypothetical protein BO66DRAFT_454407 [Aspergillus aculeatinus CBS 121060]